jgi:hypothetical protein
MNNEWNDEVVVDVSESDITVDQAYDATSENPQSGTAVAQAVEQAGGTVDQSYNASSANAQSGTAVAEAVGTPVNLVQGSGITLTESSGSVTISANAQLPAYSDADSGKVLQVQSDGTLAWVTLS